MTFLKRLSIIVVLVLIVAMAYLFSLTPSNDRNWTVDQSILPSSTISGDVVTIKNVRNFEYRSTSDYTPAYYDATVNLSDLNTVDYIVEPFGSIGAAHTFLSFGFKDGQQIAISVEIRKEKGESFSPLKGIARQYELMYVIADERDVIDLRTNYRQDIVYLYPTSASPEKARELFLNMLNKANRLIEQPEFYNTLTNNCTTNIASQIDQISDKKIGFDYRLILPEFSDVLAKELGFIASDMTIEEAREKYKINERAKKFQNDKDFSKKIREDQDLNSSSNPADLYLVSRVIDGDTVEVEINGEKKHVRYIGIDTPETVHSSKPVECYGKEASNRNRELVEGKMVRFEKDISETDKYGRLLRYVYVDNQMVNLKLISEGYANVVTYPPDVRYTDQFLQAEREAKKAELGLWNKENGCQK